MEVPQLKITTSDLRFYDNTFDCLVTYTIESDSPEQAHLQVQFGPHLHELGPVHPLPQAHVPVEEKNADDLKVIDWYID